MAHVRQSRPDAGLGFQVEGLNTFQVVPLRLEVARTPVNRDVNPLPSEGEKNVRGLQDAYVRAKTRIWP